MVAGHPRSLRTGAPGAFDPPRHNPHILHAAAFDDPAEMPLALFAPRDAGIAVPGDVEVPASDWPNSIKAWAWSGCGPSLWSAAILMIISLAILMCGRNGVRATRFAIHALTPGRWPDLVELFGPERGANSGCWCMWPRVPGADFKAMTRAQRRCAFKTVVGEGPPPGLLLYEGRQAIGWVAVGPRRSVLRFDRAKTSRLDEDTERAAPAYAITCFYVRNGHRKRGLMKDLTAAAIDFARRKKARVLDVCPMDTEKPLIWGEGFVGIASVMRDMGFIEVARRSPRRPLMRLVLS